VPSWRWRECAVSTVDIILALALLFAIVRGYGRGLFGVLAGLAAPVLAFMVAADWSDPVADYLEQSLPVPDFLLDFLAQAIIFVGIIVLVRILAGFLARIFGFGLSLPSRVVAAGFSGVIAALVLGFTIVLIRSLIPSHTAGRDEAEALVAAPVADLLTRVDARVSESVLGPRLAALASMALSEAMPYVPAQLPVSVPVAPGGEEQPAHTGDRDDSASTAPAETSDS